MKNCVYFVKQSEKMPHGPRIAPNYGFRPDGAWRGQSLPEGCAGLLLDDRFPPSRRGLEAAAEALAHWTGLIVLDFEKPLRPETEALAARLAGERLVCPPCLAALPHAALLAAPGWGGDYMRRVEALRARYGELLLDGAPLRHRVRPGGARTPWERALPAEGFPCSGALCLHRRLEDGSLLFWDTKETLTARCWAAGVSVIVFEADWNSLPP